MRGCVTKFVFLLGFLFISWIFGLLFGFFESVLAKWEPKQVSKPIDLYNHQKHFPRFAQYGIQCDLCHKTPDSFVNKEKIDRMGCHHCHNNEISKVPEAARFKCITCHKDLSQVKPDNHQLNWIDRHQAIAKQDKDFCLKCHKTFFCTDCHQNRDFEDKRMHTRGFRYYHSIVARSNPRTCSNCHQMSFCESCHLDSN